MALDINRPSHGRAGPNDFNLPFDTWFKEEIRRGADYGSIADASAAYEAAGYKFL